MTRIQAYELRDKSKSELEKELVELKQELATLRVQKLTQGGTAKISKM